jgi:hypothetical protein
MEVSGKLHVPASLPHGKSPCYPLYRRLGGSQNRSGRGGEINSQPLPRLEPPIIQPVAKSYTTEQSRLLARMGETKNACWLLVGKPLGKCLLGRLRRRWILGRWVVRMVSDGTRSGSCPLAGFDNSVVETDRVLLPESLNHKYNVSVHDFSKDVICSAASWWWPLYICDCSVMTC